MAHTIGLFQYNSENLRLFCFLQKDLRTNQMVDIVLMLSASTGLMQKAIQYTRPVHAFLMMPIPFSVTTLDRKN